MRHRALKFHPFGWVVAGGRQRHLSRDAAHHLRNLHGGPAAADLARLHGDRLRSSQPASSTTCARGFATVLVLLLAIRVFEVQTVWTDLSRDDRRRSAIRSGTSTAAPRCWSPMPIPTAATTSRDLGARACRLPRHHRAVGTGDDRVHGRRQADPACAAGLSRPRRHRGRHAADDRASCWRSRTHPNAAMQRNYWTHWTSDYDYRLRAVHRSELRKSGSGASDARSTPASGSCSIASTRRRWRMPASGRRQD